MFEGVVAFLRGLIEYHANQEVANERMASSESNGQQGNAPPAPSTVAGQLSSFPAPPGGLSPPVEAERKPKLLYTLQASPFTRSTQS